MFKRKNPVPRWAVKRIMELYKQSIDEVIAYRKAVNIDSMLANGKMTHDAKTVSDLRRYSYAIGEVEALETLMDRLFIDYDDEGKVPEIYY